MDIRVRGSVVSDYNINEHMYYKLTSLIDNKHIYPQVECLTPFTVQQLSPWHKLRAKPTLKFKLKKRAELSDLLSTTCGPVCDLLISPKFLNILSRFQVIEYQILKSTVLSNNGEAVYNLLDFYGLSIVEYINFEDSNFIETEWTFSKSPIEITSFEQYLSLKELDSSGAFGVAIDKIVFKEHFGMDLFFIFPFDSTIYISEKLADSIVTEGITGICLQKAGNIVKK